MRQLLPALRILVIMTVLLGVLYPAAILAIGRLMPGRTGGSLLQADGRVVGSSLLAQEFTSGKYFWPRPSVGDYNPLATGGSNLGPNNPDLEAAIRQRKAQVAAANRVSPSQVPADAVTASGSGLDPDISPAYAQIQVDRVAQARGVSSQVVRGLVAAHTRGRALGFLGDPAVNVLELNLALDQLTPPQAGAR